MFYLGLDFGTSGARTCVLDQAGEIVHESRAAYADQANPQHWRNALFDLISGIPVNIRNNLAALAIDGTSGTLLATNAQLEPVSPALLYNDGRAVEEAELIKEAAHNPNNVIASAARQSRISALPEISGSPRRSAPRDDESEQGLPDESQDDRQAIDEAEQSKEATSNPNDVIASVARQSRISALPNISGSPRRSAPRDEGNKPQFGPTSGLAKRLWLAQHFSDAAYCFHQADWLAALLTGKPGITDYHNALKSGYDVENLCWPDWTSALPGSQWQQKVLSPGEAIGPINPNAAKRLEINPDCIVRAGTTDSIAAFIAAGVSQPGEAVTSLGTTLVLKLLSEKRVEDPASGVYSHRFGRLWLAGGASNSGGGVLKQFFNNEELSRLSAQINPGQPSGLDYYPLPKPGERFPVNDALLAPRMSPRPADDAQFLHALLEGMARIEALGYAKLRELGATPLEKVVTAGGGAHNPAWQKIRENLLGVPVSASLHAEAACGTARLAREGSSLLA